MHLSPSSRGNDKTPWSFVLHCRYLAAILPGQSQGVCEPAHSTDTLGWEAVSPTAAATEILLGVTLSWWSQEQMLSLGPTSQGQNFTCSPLPGVVFTGYSGKCFTGADLVSACQSETLVLLNMRLVREKHKCFSNICRVAGGRESGADGIQRILKGS